MGYSLDIDADMEHSEGFNGDARSVLAERVRRFSMTINHNDEPVFRILNADTVEVMGAGFDSVTQMVERANQQGDGLRFTDHEIKRAIDLLHAVGYGNLCADMGDDEKRDTLIEAGGWLQWLVDNDHL